MAKKAKTEQPVLAIYIQEITTSWTKASRGGDGAVKRGRVPDAVELPQSPFPSSATADKYPFYLHLLWYTEYHGYDVRSEYLKSDVAANPISEILNRDGVKVSFSGDSLAVRYQWDWNLGAPGRRTQDSTGTFVPVHHSPEQKAFELQIGQWGRILFNGRHSDWDDGRWTYSQHTFNIGLFLNPPQNVFLETAPVKVYSKMAHLW